MSNYYAGIGNWTGNTKMEALAFASKLAELALIAAEGECAETIDFRPYFCAIMGIIDEVGKDLTKEHEQRIEQEQKDRAVAHVESIHRESKERRASDRPSGTRKVASK
ncbi:MAG TPA: hypothetical protein VGM06_01840 [Polyangiaceae bacterium]|jgi:hypothetical protein